ncbi:unnamed protein product, partial [Allacma fusca]
MIFFRRLHGQETYENKEPVFGEEFQDVGGLQPGHVYLMRIVTIVEEMTQASDPQGIYTSPLARLK